MPGEVVCVFTPKTISVFGLIVELIGFLLIWKCGLPRSIPEVRYIIADSGKYTTDELKRVETRYGRVAHLGLTFVVGGVLVQVISYFV